MDKYQFVDNLISQIHEIPVDAIVGSYVQLVRGTTHKEGLCPFHNDKNLGSFKVTPSRGMWYCFTCDMGGEAITFVKEYYGIGYIEATFKIGLDFGLIEQSDYVEYFEKKRYSDKKIKIIEKAYAEANKRMTQELQGNIAKPEVLDDIFRTFMSFCSLSETHQNHLNTERGFTDEEIAEEGFFTFPTRHISKKFLEKITEKYGSDEILGHVPGFFKEVKTNKFSFMVVKGIGLPINNVNKQIIGIQVRRDDMKNNNRYIWFGSAFANSKEEYSNGTSAGSPIDVIIPKEIITKTVFVTEGRFKAIKLAKEKKAVVLSIQGVSTWRGAIEVLKELQNHPNVNASFVKGSEFVPKYILMAYDADISHNCAVFEQLQKFTKELTLNDYNVYYLYWDGRVAKGIDDLYKVGREDLVGRYNVDNFNEFYDVLTKELVKELGLKKTKEIPKEILGQRFYEKFNLSPLKKNER